MSSLFSPSWYRMCDIVPRLRSQARIYRHVYRKQPWHLVQDLSSGKFIRLNPVAYRVLTLMDGQRSLDEIWKRACDLLEDDAPSQDEVLQLMSQLHQTGVLATNRMPDIDELHERTEQNRKTRIKQYIANPLALRIPLIDPDRFLTRLVGWMPGFTRPILFILWLLGMFMGVVLAVTHWQELTQDITKLVFTPEYIVTLILVFPLVKAIHELGHGIAIKLFGGQCHEMGIMLLIMVPIPYVDASHATAFTSKYQRMIVGAAGMMIELFVASIALLLWTWTQPGLARVFLHDVIILAGVVTIFFNLNPLLRFDGYYILSDWLEIPNLGNKANQYIGFLAKRYLMRVKKGLQPPKVTPREPAWLISYSILSFIYRMMIVVTIILFVASQFFIFGVLLALWAAYLMLILPFSKTVKHIWQDPLLSEKRPRLYSLTALFGIGIIWLVAFVPFPSSTNVDGVVWMADQSQIRAPNACFVQQLLINPGPVLQGQPLLYCSDPVLETRKQVLLAQQKELEAELVLARGVDRVQAQLIEDELISKRLGLQDLESRIAEFTVISPHDGEFVLPASKDIEARWYQRGEIMGFILDPNRFTFIMAVPQSAIDRVRSDQQSITLRPIERLDHLYEATILRAVPSATRNLPNMALTLAGGGKLGLDPNSEADKPQSLSPVFLFELGVDDPHRSMQSLGSRVYVRIEHSAEPLMIQGYRVIREVFMQRFGI